MLHPIRVAAAVLNQTPLDWSGNKARIVEVLHEAREQGVGILCLPELCLSGYGCEDAFFSPNTLERSMAMLQELLPMTAGMAVTFGLPLRIRNAIFNVAAFVVNGDLLGMVAKQNLAGDGIHYEPRWFKAWPAAHVMNINICGKEVPVGDVQFEVGGVRIGFEICEDAWVAVRPGGQLAQRGVDIILNPSASHFAFGKLEVRKGFVVEGSRAFGLTYVYSNLLGNESGRAIFDGGSLIASGGRLCAVGPRFGFEDSVLTSAVVDVAQTRVLQSRTASFRPDVDPYDERWISHPMLYPIAKRSHSSMKPAQAAWERSETIKEEEFTRAVALGLFDYLRKARINGWVVSLSGGADSAAVVCLCRLTLELVAGQLGVDGLIERLNYIPGLERGVDEISKRMITTAYQATRNSGDVTKDAAAAVAKAASSDHYELDVDALVAGYTELIGKAIGRELNWEQDDITLQNIQARSRGPSIWMFANLRNQLLLATSNRSEASVGYATMDGDTCGGVSPIAGIDKAFLRQWLRWLETEGPKGLAPVPALAAVNMQQPTAELRPASEGQTDEDDLMPYIILDAIEKAAIRDKRAPADALNYLQSQFPDVEHEDLRDYVQRFFRLWSYNQWKRERYAPSFHLDDENLDPKTWCRFPILSGAFRDELAELTQE